MAPSTATSSLILSYAHSFVIPIKSSDPNPILPLHSGFFLKNEILDAHDAKLIVQPTGGRHVLPAKNLLKHAPDA